MSDSNNGHTTGQGKAFVLAQPKSPEEIKRENTRRMLPELRRNCSQDPRLQKFVGAKWLFGQLTDLSFLHIYGGDTNGKVYINIRDLHRIYGHDRNTLSRWLDKLVDTGWIWMREMWPKTEIGICGVAQQPELFVPHMNYTQQMVRSKDVQEPANPPEISKSPENSHSGGTAQPEVLTHPASDAHGRSQSGGIHEPVWPVEPASDAGSEPPKGGQEPASDARGTSQSGGMSVAKVARRRSHIKEIPVGEGSLGAIGGGTPPPKSTPADGLEGEFQAWCAEMRRLFPRERAPIRTELVAQRDSKPKGMVRDFIKRKIAFLDSLKHGPLPADEPQRAALVVTMQPERREKPSAAEQAKGLKEIREFKESLR